MVQQENRTNVAVFSPAQCESRFIDDFRRWAREDADRLPRRDSTLFVGSSSVRRWETIAEDLAPLDIIHRGFGGSRMSDVLSFREFFARYEAARVLVYEGDNDLADAGSRVSDFLHQCRQFIESIFAVRSDAEIRFISVKPSVRRASRIEAFREANVGLRRLCEADERLGVIDVFTPMLNQAGKPAPEIFGEDSLHMNEKGYAIWRDVVREALGLEG